MSFVVIMSDEKWSAKPSPIHGMGRFAAAPIAMGEVVANGSLIRQLAEMRISGEYVCGFNHSCRPNCELIGTTLADRKVVALSDIATGDELTVGYKNADGCNIPSPCNCGSCSR